MAFRAFQGFAVPELHKVAQAGAIVWKALIKLLQCEGLSLRGLFHGRLHTYVYRVGLYVCQVYNRDFSQGYPLLAKSGFNLPFRRISRTARPDVQKCRTEGRCFRTPVQDRRMWECDLHDSRPAGFGPAPYGITIASLCRSPP